MQFQNIVPDQTIVSGSNFIMIYLVQAIFITIFVVYFYEHRSNLDQKSSIFTTVLKIIDFSVVWPFVTCTCNL
jgi:hypothetical protein